MEHGAQKPQELRLDLPAAHSAERKARQILREFAKSEGVPEREIETLEFVAGELLSNAVDHGGGQRAMEEKDLPGRVRMTLHLVVQRDTWTLRVGDQGGGDPDRVRARLGDLEMPDVDDERGRGLYLLVHMLDSLDVVRTADGKGLEFVAVRRHGTA